MMEQNRDISTEGRPSKLTLLKATDMSMVTIQDDNWGGWESGGKWLAWRVNDTDDIPWQSYSQDDDERWQFWQTYTGIVGKGNTPNDALVDLYSKVKQYQIDQYGNSDM